MSQSNAVKNGSSELKGALLIEAPRIRRAFLFGFIGSLLILVPTAYMFEVYGRVVYSRSHTTLLMLTLFAVFALAVMECLEWARTETMREVGDKLDAKLTQRVYRALFELNLVRPGGATVQPLQDLKVIRDFLPGPALAAIPEIPAAMVFLVLVFMLSPVLGMLALLGAIVQVTLAWANERQTQPLLTQANRMAMAAQQSVDAMLRHAEVTRAMGMRPALHLKWYAYQRDMLDIQANASDRAGIFQSATKFVQTTLGSALLGFAAWLVLENALWGGPAMLIVGSVLGGRVLAPLVQAVTQWRSIAGARDAWGRLDGLLRQVPEAIPGMTLPEPRGRLAVEGLVAGAPGGGNQILRGIQFELNSGDALAVVGPSASGKTTLAKLLVGVWPALAGKVRLDGADVFSWSKLELGPHMGYLPQGVELLDGTIAQNICRFGPINERMMQDAATAVGMHDWIMSLPEQYDTAVGFDATRLSGGQRQKIGLARALYGDPVLVVLDEPNSSLDEQGDKALAEAISKWRARGSVFVVVTHRSSVLPVCSHMLVLRDGMQQAFGLRDDVLAALQKKAPATQTSPKETVSSRSGTKFQDGPNDSSSQTQPRIAAT